MLFANLRKSPFCAFAPEPNSLRRQCECVALPWPQLEAYLPALLYESRRRAGKRVALEIGALNSTIRMRDVQDGVALPTGIIHQPDLGPLAASHKSKYDGCRIIGRQDRTGG